VEPRRRAQRPSEEEQALTRVSRVERPVITEAEARKRFHRQIQEIKEDRLIYTNILAKRHTWDNRLVHQAEKLQSISSGLPRGVNPDRGVNLEVSGFIDSDTWSNRSDLEGILKALTIIWVDDISPLPTPSRRDQFGAIAYHNINMLKRRIEELRPGRGFTQSLLKMKPKKKSSKKIKPKKTIKPKKPSTKKPSTKKPSTKKPSTKKPSTKKPSTQSSTQSSTPQAPVFYLA